MNNEREDRAAAPAPDVDAIMALADEWAFKHLQDDRDALSAAVEQIVRERDYAVDMQRWHEAKWQDCAKNQKAAAYVSLGWTPIECLACGFEGAREMDNWKVLKERAERAERDAARLRELAGEAARAIRTALAGRPAFGMDELIAQLDAARGENK